MRNILLRRVLCRVAGTWDCWRDYEEDLLWHCFSWFGSLDNNRLACKHPSPQDRLPTTDYFQLPAKFVFVRLLRNSRHLTSNTITHWVTWLSCTFSVLLIAYIIASAIPVFGGLVSLAGALLGTVLSIQPMGCMWLYDNWSEGKVNKSPGWIFMVCWSVFVILAGTFLTVAGTYGSIVSIYTSYHANGGSSAFSCADNSNSV